MKTKTILITGTSSGIGLASIKLFSKNGWNVIAAQRNHENGKMQYQSPKLIYVKMDVTDKASVKQGIEEGIAHFGSIDVLVNNAGKGMHGVFEGVSENEIRSLFEVNLFGVINTTKAILPYFRKQNYGKIINISSMGGRIGLPLRGVYNSSKFAVEGLSEVLLYELKPFNISIKLVEPGFVSTRFHKSLYLSHMDDVEIYKKQTDRLKKSTTHNGRGAKPEKVASVIYKAVTSNSGKLRYIAGNDAQFAQFMRTLLPFRAFSKILSMQNV